MNGKTSAKKHLGFDPPIENFREVFGLIYAH